LVLGAFSKRIGSFRFNYATKLQLYLNFAFFFPILIISLIIIGLFTSSYQEELHRQYLQKTSLVTDNLSPIIEKRNSGILEKDELLETMNNLSGNANTDINLYSKEGILVSTSQPNIFDKKVLTNYINPNAIVELVEGQNNLVLLEEKIGNLTFKSVYSAIRSKDGQEVQAIVAVPFFESETELDLLIADVLSNIIKTNEWTWQKVAKPVSAKDRFIGGLGVTDSLIPALFSLKNPQETTSSLINITSRNFIFRLIARKDAPAPTLEQLKEAAQTERALFARNFQSDADRKLFERYTRENEIKRNPSLTQFE